MTRRGCAGWGCTRRGRAAAGKLASCVIFSLLACLTVTTCEKMRTLWPCEDKEWASGRRVWEWVSAASSSCCARLSRSTAVPAMKHQQQQGSSPGLPSAAQEQGQQVHSSRSSDTDSHLGPQLGQQLVQQQHLAAAPHEHLQVRGGELARGRRRRRLACGCGEGPQDRLGQLRRHTTDAVESRRSSPCHNSCEERKNKRKKKRSTPVTIAVLGTTAHPRPWRRGRPRRGHPAPQRELG